MAQSNNALFMGMAGGTLLSMYSSLTTGDILKTMLLATLGAVVSFTVSLLLRCLMKKRKK
ncbi:hypothetical protein [Flavobacterium sp.]|uniref:hypothetical protein n=1 Tax=Flavobacterium sp. TaxID=239 RepID=UPI002BD0E8A8|nr:hypothetical protein [Flavobacterium sp.]HQA74132.1 hypothetical protein [Flavobacterium sp.]